MSAAEQHSSRGGRPRRDQAGEVETRLLDAAASMFLSRGFARTSMHQVAQSARSGKTSLYSRYPTKGALFAAVVQRSVGWDTDFGSELEAGASTQDKLTETGLMLADRTLTEQSIAMMRVTAAEAEAFPEIALEGHRIGFGLCVASIARCLVRAGEFDSPEDATPMARRFVELALHPLYFHALAGHDLAGLRSRARLDVPQTARYLLTQSDDIGRDVP